MEPATTFPYERARRPDGSPVYRIPEPNQRVVVLGDVRGTRTAELASQGHRVTHIDRNPTYLRMTRNAVLRDLKERHINDGETRVQFVEDDWFNGEKDGSYRANYVEAYHPINENPTPNGPGDVPRRGNSHRAAELSGFIDMTLSKLAPGRNGKGVFIISEQREVIEDMAKVVRADPQGEPSGPPDDVPPTPLPRCGANPRIGTR